MKVMTDPVRCAAGRSACGGHPSAVQGWEKAPLAFVHPAPDACSPPAWTGI
jgi:hypothetical protein